MFSFYEKPQVPNRVLLKDTALPEQTIRSSLIQEVVRRMQNCCEEIGLEERQRILSNLAEKMINSGHSQKSTMIMIVQGVTKYLDNLRLSKLEPDHKHYRPMYLSKEFNQVGRQVEKYMPR